MLPTIRQGSTNKYVKVAQYLTGYVARKESSGIFDAKFVAAACAWQRNNGLTPDGIIGKDSWTKMAEVAPTCSTSKNKTSAATCALQILLDAGLDADGIFGTKTKNAVAAFQSSKGLAADGVCGPKTWMALITNSVADESKFKQPVDYKQYDSKWGSKMYSATGKSTQTVKTSGCGPTAAADVVATLKDSSVTPWTLCELYLKKGFRTASNSTPTLCVPASS